MGRCCEFVVEFDSEPKELALNIETIKDIATPTANVVKEDNVATITVHDIHGTTTAQVFDGEKGDKGDKGDKGENGRDGYVQYTAGTGIDISDDNVISSTALTSVAWGEITGDIREQADLTTALGDKVSAEPGKGLSTNDFTNAYKQKLDAIVIPNIVDDILNV